MAEEFIGVLRVAGRAAEQAQRAVGGKLFDVDEDDARFSGVGVDFALVRAFLGQRFTEPQLGRVAGVGILAVEHALHCFRRGRFTERLHECIGGGNGGVKRFAGGFAVRAAAPGQQQEVVAPEVQREVGHLGAAGWHFRHGAAGFHDFIALRQGVALHQSAEAHMHQPRGPRCGGRHHHEVTGLGVEGVVAVFVSPAGGFIKVALEEFLVLLLQCREIRRVHHGVDRLSLGGDVDAQRGRAAQLVAGGVLGVICLDGQSVVDILRRGNIGRNGQQNIAARCGNPHRQKLEQLGEGACVAQAEHVHHHGQHNKGGGNALRHEQTGTGIGNDFLRLSFGADFGEKDGETAAERQCSTGNVHAGGVENKAPEGVETPPHGCTSPVGCGRRSSSCCIR